MNLLKQSLTITLLACSSTMVNAASLLGDVTEPSPAVYDLTANGVSESTIESTLGLTSGALDTLSNTNVTNGSAIWDTVNINTGDIFSFDWIWTNEEVDQGYSPYDFGDFAFATFSLDNSLNKFVDTFQPTGTSGTYQWTSTGTGPLTWAVGVVNTEDKSVSSGVTISNLTTISAVPEPSIYALLLGGIGLVGFMAAKRRKQVTL